MQLESPAVRLHNIVDQADTSQLINYLHDSMKASDSLLIPDFAEVFSASIQELNHIINIEHSSTAGDMFTYEKTLLLPNGSIILWGSSYAIIYSLTDKRLHSYFHFFESYRFPYSNDFFIKDIQFSQKLNNLLFAGNSREDSYHALKTLDFELASSTKDNTYHVGKGRSFLIPEKYVHLHKFLTRCHPLKQTLLCSGEGSNNIVPLGDNYFIINMGNSKTVVISHKGDSVFTIDEPASCYAVSAKGWLAIGYAKNKYIKIYEYNIEGILTFKNKFNTETYINALAIKGDDFIICAGKRNYWTSSENQIQVWDCNGKLIDFLPPQPSPVIQLLTLPNGWLCTVSDKVRIWNLTSKTIELTYEGLYVQLTPDGNLSILSSEKLRFLNVSIRNESKIIENILNSMLPTDLKYKLFYIHNLVKSNIYQANLCNQSIKDSAGSALVDFLSFTNLTHVDLSFNLFTNLGLHVIYNLFFTMKHLQYLNLSGNGIDFAGFSLISKILEENQNANLQSINLSKNHIECEAASLRKFKAALEHSPSLTNVDLSQNFLLDDCDLLFDEEKSQEPTFSYSFFKTYSNSVKSQIDKQREITRTQWMVAFSCNASKNHAFILLEGMRKNGQLFMETYDISTRDWIIGKARINGGRFSPEYYKNFNFHHQSFVINDQEGYVLRQSITNKIGNKINFCMFSGSSIDSVNCVEWCNLELAKIGIKVRTAIIPTPRQVASQKGYIIS